MIQTHGDSAHGDSAHGDSTANAASNTKPKIQFTNVNKSFDDTVVLDCLDWSIDSGGVVGLLGVNGSGKSTLIRCMLGLLKPDAGQITIDGEDVWDLSEGAKSRLSFVDQHPKYYPWMNGSQLLHYVGAFYPNWNEQRVYEIAKQWQVPLDKRFGTLSPGQQQKVAILTAMGNDPDLLVLDEPVSSLDPLARRDFLRSLLEITQDENRTVLLSTHITSDLERVASHIAILNEGKIRWYDELDEVKDRVKCIRLHSQSDLPQNLSVPNAIRISIAGQNATAIVAAWDEDAETELRQRYDVDVDVENLNLEDIFIEFHSATEVAE